MVSAGKVSPSGEIFHDLSEILRFTRLKSSILLRCAHRPLRRLSPTPLLLLLSAKTGHGSVDSLWHYIDLAWEELGVWGSIDKAIARLHAADQLFADLLGLQHETETLGKRQANKKIDLKQIADRLGEIISVAKQDIEVHELHGKHF